MNPISLWIDKDEKYLSLSAFQWCKVKLLHTCDVSSLSSTTSSLNSPGETRNGSTTWNVFCATSVLAKGQINTRLHARTLAWHCLHISAFYALCNGFIAFSPGADCKGWWTILARSLSSAGNEITDYGCDSRTITWHRRHLLQFRNILGAICVLKVSRPWFRPNAQFTCC